MLITLFRRAAICQVYLTGMAPLRVVNHRFNIIDRDIVFISSIFSMAPCQLFGPLHPMINFSDILFLQENRVASSKVYCLKSRLSQGNCKLGC